MRSKTLLVVFLFVGILGILQAKPLPPDKDKKEDTVAPFKPIEIKNELAEGDPKDVKLNNPSRKFPVKLHKDKTYVIDMVSKDFDAYLRLLDKKGKQLAEDDDGGGDLNARIIHSPAESGDFTIVATTFDGQLGKFTIKVRELNIKGEAKARALGKDGLTINDDIGDNDKTDLDKLSKVLTMQLKGGQSYLFEIDSGDFDPHVYVFDTKGKLLGQDPAKTICAAAADGPYHVIVKSFDSQLGKFELKIRSFKLQGEPKPRELGKDGLTIKAAIGDKDKTPLEKLGKVYSVQLKAGQTYTIDLEGKDLDCFLYLFDAKSALLAQDDDSVAPNSRIVFEAPRDGVYHILATTVDGKEMGDFTLNVRKKN